MRISDWSSDVCSSDLAGNRNSFHRPLGPACARAATRLRALPDAVRRQRQSRRHDVRRRAVHACRIAGWRAVPGELRYRALLPDRQIARHALQEAGDVGRVRRSEEHTSELQTLMRISYAVFFLKKNTIL